MDGILALGHFCESHGPCVVLCTQKCDTEPKPEPHTLSVPVCEACQSIQLDLALISREKNYNYITTRTPLQQNTAFLLRHATIRSLSCEQEGTLYFGDNERGHVFSHSFMVQDSLARGFQRKYTILMLAKDKNNLLNTWPYLCKYSKEIAQELQKCSANVNEMEQAQMSQRAVRQTQGSPYNISRSLSQLTGKPTVYAHLHLWFAWILGCKVAEEIPFKNNLLPILKPTSMLRALYQNMGEKLFQKVCNLLLGGILIKSNDATIVTALYSLLPKNVYDFIQEKSKEYCLINKINEHEWEIETTVTVCDYISTLQKNIEQSLADLRLTESALEPQLASYVTEWHSSTRVLTWCPKIDLKLLQSLNIVKTDLYILNFWILQMTTCSEKHKSIMKMINLCFN